MDRPGVRQVPEGSGEQGKMEKTSCKIIFGAPTTLAVKGLMMMMMMTMMIFSLPHASETGDTLICMFVFEASQNFQAFVGVVVK